MAISSSRRSINLVTGVTKIVSEDVDVVVDDVDAAAVDIVDLDDVVVVAFPVVVIVLAFDGIADVVVVCDLDECSFRQEHS